ncbi:MAG TPA: DnaJ domain-containing protein [Pyrinomonadaceae bacterium]|nr:DnaJ domain-containing protein [Pyrinomonadaceae bacterium]
MSTDLSKAYELLGVKPGVSIRELKAAHRDLAKVWHPDRFQHDPRLQEKAQEKLKEINEAYDLLSSGKVPRPAAARPEPTPQGAYRTAYAQPEKAATPHSTGSWKWIAVLLVFAAVFAYTTRSLLQRRQPVGEPESAQQVQLDKEASTRTDARTRPEATRKVTHDDGSAAPEVQSSSAPIQTQPAAVPTVAVTIDPQSGLLAKPDCPVRTRVTYPRGSEPTGHCNINHAPPPKDSRIKSLTEKILK